MSQRTSVGKLHTALVVLFSSFLFVEAAHADVTRDEAEDIMLDILSPGGLDRDAAAYLSLEPLNPGDKVVPSGDETREFVVERAVWFGWIDDEPEAFFSHRVRFVYIDVETGKAKVVVQEWWPEVNEEPIFAQDEIDQHPELQIFSSRVEPVSDEEEDQ